jgi:RHS repeat-associated protein
VTTKRFFPQGEQQGSINLYYTRDHLGSIRDVLDSTATLRARYDYDPYGRVTKVSGDLNASFTYAGYYVHSPSGLLLTHYRAYDPNLGRWISDDPIGLAGGINFYGYVSNSPIGMIDPLGLFEAQDNNQPTVTIIVTSDKEFGKQFGSHSAVYLNNTSDGPVLYDPAGTYKSKTRGSAGILTKEYDGATVADFTKYQNSTGSKVSTVTIPVSAADQENIYKNALSIGDPRLMSCAISVSTALKGVGPFKNLKTTHLPGTLLKEVRAIKKELDNPQ